MLTAVLVAVATGLLVATQTALLARGATRFPPLVVSLLVQVGGLLLGGAWAALRARGPTVDAVLGTPWWWLAAGGIGWLIVGGLATASSRLGVAAGLSVVVAAQILGGVVVDARTGIAPLDVRGLAGCVLVVAGVWLLATRAVQP